MLMTLNYIAVPAYLRQLIIDIIFQLAMKAHVDTQQGWHGGASESFICGVGRGRVNP
jgi:hypothetical protein